MSQDLQIHNVPEDKMQALVERAGQSGTTPEEYALHLIVQGLSTSGREKTFDEILAPFRREVKDSGLTDGELTNLFTRARRDYAREQKG